MTLVRIAKTGLEAWRLVVVALLSGAIGAAVHGQPIQPAGEYRTCPIDQTLEGIEVVQPACGTVERPNVPTSYQSLADLRSAQSTRDRFRSQVANYGACVSDFIDDQRRPGADATSRAPDQAACAHAWAEQQATELVREVGYACIDFSNRSMTDKTIAPWSGDCFPTSRPDQG